jgi:hypothetical protein
LTTTRYISYPFPPRNHTNPSTQAAAFNPPEDPYSAEQVERPNVAAIAAQDAVRRMGSDLADEKENETSSSSNGNDLSGIDERVWHDKNEAQRSADDDDANHHIERRRSSRDTRTTRDQMAVEAESLSRSGRGSMRRAPSGGDAWV